MDKPQVGLSCPDGLQFLTILDKVVIKPQNNAHKGTSPF